MDNSRFDELSRSIAETLSRRRLAWLLGRVGLSGTLILFAENRSTAKRRKGKRKKRRPVPPTVPPPLTGILPQPPACSPACGICQQCVDGTCETVPNFTPCGRCKECFAGACEAVPDGRRCGTCLVCQAGVCNNQECLVCEDCIDNVCRPKQCSPPDLCQTDCQCDPVIDRCVCSPRVCEPQHPCEENCICNRMLGCQCQFQC